MSRRTLEDMPKKNQVVIVDTVESAYFGSAGTVTQHLTTDRGTRPYTVRFNDGVKRNFRQSDLVLAQ